MRLRGTSGDTSKIHLSGQVIEERSLKNKTSDKIKKSKFRLFYPFFGHWEPCGSHLL